MAKYLEYPIATQEIAGSNPRRVTYFFLILDKFFFSVSERSRGVHLVEL